MSDYILADDLSGALETGAAFRVRGWRVTLPLDVTAVEQSGPGELQVVSTETRAESPERAAETVRRAVASRKAAGSRLLFKKIDSTLRGPIGAELAAVISEVAPALIVVCPANPAAGRVVKDGVLLVDGVPLAESNFRNDPQWPAADSRVGEILMAQGLASPGRLSLESLREGSASAAFFASMAAGNRVLVADAETAVDLRMIAASVREAGADSLLVGSGALASALAELLPANGGPRPESRLDECRSVLILCGSAHPRSHEQMGHLASHCNVPVLSFFEGETSEAKAIETLSASLRSRGVAAVRFSSSRGASAESAPRLQEAIGRLSRTLLGCVSPDLIVLTGGETAWTVCREIEATHLEVLNEIEPGVVVSRLQGSDVGAPLVVTKPGSFGSKSVLSALLPLAMK